MKFTDLFVRRPVLSVVVSLLILVLGVVPLVIATGPGAGGRRFMGIVIFTGLSIGTIFTLFIVPAVCLREGAAAGRRAGDNRRGRLRSASAPSVRLDGNAAF